MKFLDTYINVSLAFWVIVTIVFGAIAWCNVDIFGDQIYGDTAAEESVEAPSKPLPRSAKSPGAGTGKSVIIRPGCDTNTGYASCDEWIVY